MSTAHQSLSEVQSADSAASIAILRWMLLVGVAFGVVAASFGWIAKSTTIASPVAQPVPSAPIGTAPAPGTYPPPNFQLASLDGRILGPPDFAGEVVLLEFWATWCGPCRLQAKHLEKLHAEFDGKGVQFLAVDSGEDEATVRSYVEKTPFPYPVLLDPQSSLSNSYGINALPTIMIVDRQGAISFMRPGVSDVNTLRQALLAAGANA